MTWQLAGDVVSVGLVALLALYLLGRQLRSWLRLPDDSEPEHRADLW